MDPNCQLVVVREAGEAWTCLDYKYAILYIYNKLCKNTQVYSHPLWSLFLFLLVQPAWDPATLQYLSYEIMGARLRDAVALCSRWPKNVTRGA